MYQWSLHCIGPRKMFFTLFLLMKNWIPLKPALPLRIWKVNMKRLLQKRLPFNRNTLLPIQQQQLVDVLCRFPALVDGTLGHYPHAKVHLEVDASKPPPKFHKAYPLPWIHLETFKKELLCLVEIGVLSQITGSSHCFPTFFIPKKDGRLLGLQSLGSQ